MKRNQSQSSKYCDPHGAHGLSWRILGACRMLRVSFCVLVLLQLACALSARAGEGRDTRRKPKIPALPELGEEDLLQIREILANMCKAFMQGKAGGVMTLIGKAGDSERRAEIREALVREFESEEYEFFKVLGEVEPDDKLMGNRHSVWVRLHFKYRHRDSKVTTKTEWLENYHNDVFIFRKNKHGRFALVDSQFFDTLGRRQMSINIPEFLLLGIILILASMGVWVWMGFEAFRLRPRSHVWRAFVLLVPLLGALVYLFWIYLPGLRKGRIATE